MSDNRDSELRELKLTNRLLAQILIQDKESNTEKVRTLDNCGFPPSEIADLLKMKLNNVTATLSNIRKAAGKKAKGEGGLK